MSVQSKLALYEGGGETPLSKLGPAFSDSILKEGAIT